MTEVGQTTAHDSVLPYPEEPYMGMGYVIPGFGDDVFTANPDIAQLVSDIGRRTQQVASTACALLVQPPKADTLFLMQGLFDALRTNLDSLTVADNQRNISSPHVTPRNRDFLIFPLPFTKLQNPWIIEWLDLSLTGLSMMMQDEENAHKHKWGIQFQQRVGAVYREIEERIGTKLLKLTPAVVQAQDWKLTKELITANYKWSEWYQQTDGAQPVPLDLRPPTEDARKRLVRGIPARLIKRAPDNANDPSDAGSSPAAAGNALPRA